MRTLQSSVVAATIILTMLSGLGGTAIAQDSVEESTEPESILFLGNSFSFWEGGVWDHVAKLAASEDPPRSIEVDSYTEGGVPLKYFAGTLATTGIRDGDHDVVVLQGDIPENYQRSVEPFLEAARILDKEVRDAGAQPVYYMTWPFIMGDWIGQGGIEAAHRQIEEELDATVAPVAMAMIDSLMQRPDLDMLGPDVSHPSIHGMYLAAAVIYATIYGRSPEGLTYRPEGVTEGEAAYLQRIAWEAIGAWQAGVMSPTPDAGAWVTGTESTCQPDWAAPPARVTFHDGIWRISDLVLSCPHRSSDPRVSGSSTRTWSCDCQFGTGSPTWGTMELVGPDGSWVGSIHGTRATDGSGHSFAVLDGTGAYEGLTYMLDLTHGIASSDLEGVISEGAPPETTD